ncbi:DinB family protein [Paenibacillus macerans]|uniref:DinB family protein n=1 Tax=Paenibacillus macerans TaxID=44252 RepID=UPI003D3184D4
MNLEQRKLWNENHQQLTALLPNPKEHDQAVELFLRQHAWLYSSRMLDSGLETMEDELLDGITEETFRQYPAPARDTKNSIAWHLWHIARIEDMTMNVLVGGREQVFHTGDWSRKLNIHIIHTGNGMTEEEAAELSAKMDLAALLDYRLEVGKKTREAIGLLEPGQFKRKVTPDGIQTLRDQGAVKPDAEWLLDYWGNKTFAGLVLMPATRHNFLHLNKAIRIKQKIQK